MADKIIFANPDLLVMIKEAVGSVVMPEVQIKLLDTGLLHSRLDASRAAHLRINIPKSEIQEYSISSERRLGISGERFAYVVDRMKRLKDPVEITIIDDEMTVSNIGTPKREFSLRLLVVGEESQDLVLTPDTVVEITGDELFEQIKDMKGTAKHIIVETTDKSITLNGISDDGNVRVETDFTSEFILSNSGPPSKSMYALEYLHEITKFYKQFDSVKMNFETNKPLTFIAKSGATEFRTLVAPRVARRG